MSGEEREGLKWSLELFEKYVLSVRDAFDAHRERYRVWAQAIEEDFAASRNIILVLLPLGITVILALSPSGLIPYLSKEHAFGALLIWLGGGFIAFVLVYISKKKIHDYIREMDASFFSAKGIISSFRGYALSHPLHFDRIDKKSIDFCYQFTSVAAGSAALEIRHKFQNMLKHRSLLPGTKPFLKIEKELDDGIKTMTSEIEKGKRVYLEKNATWASEKSLSGYMADFRIMFTDFIDYSLQQNETSQG